MTADHGRPPLVWLLGPVRAWRGDRELGLGGPQRQAVLGLLALRANQAVSRSELIDGIWGEDPPPSAVNALHVHVAALRRALEPHRASRAPGEFLLATGPGYSLRLAPGQLDAQVFGRHLDAARAFRAAGDLRAAVRSFDAALRLWRAVPLSGAPGPWAEIERVRLEEVRLTAIEERTGIMLMLGRAAAAAAELTGLVREHPLREGLRGQLMVALYRYGRQADALAVFADGRRVLVEELGLEPGPGLRRLHEQILAGDAALGPPADAVTLRRPAPVWAAPAQLPGDVDAFTGRAGELAALDKLAATVSPPGAPVICVSGTAGVGKTSLVVRWARRARGAFPDGQLYVNLRGYDPGQPVPAGDALAGFLLALGVPGQDIPREVDERAAAYRTVLDRRRMLVVLDNASSVEQVRPLLPGSPSSLVLVTSRDSLAGLVARHGARRLDLDTLPPQDAIKLLRTLIGDRAEIQPDATAVLVAVSTRASVQGWPGHATGLAGTVYRYLETGGHYPDAITIHTAARQAARRTGDRAAEATALTNLGIVDWRQGRYREAASHHRRALRVSREIGDRFGEAIALNNLGTIYERQGRRQQAAEHYRQTAILSAELDDRSGEARALANLGGIDCLQGRYEQAAGHLQRALVLFRDIGDLQGEAAALAGLGVVDGRQGRYERAAEHYRQALSLARQIGDRPGEAETHNGAGAVLLAAGRSGQARAAHHAALALASRIGDKYEQARAHDGLARAYHVTGDHGRARHSWEQALALFTVLGAPETDDVRARLAALGPDVIRARGRLAAR